MHNIDFDEVQRKIARLPYAYRLLYQKKFEILKNKKQVIYLIKEIDNILSRTEAELGRKMKEKTKDIIEEAIEESISEMEQTLKKIKEYEDELNWIMKHDFMFKAMRPTTDSELQDVLLDMVDEDFHDFIERKEEELGIDLDADDELGEDTRHRNAVLGTDEDFRSEIRTKLEHVISSYKSKSTDEIKKHIEHLLKEVIVLDFNSEEIKKGYIDKEYRERIRKMMEQRLNSLAQAQLVPLVFLYNYLGLAMTPEIFRSSVSKSFVDNAIILLSMMKNSTSTQTTPAAQTTSTSTSKSHSPADRKTSTTVIVEVVNPAEIDDFVSEVKSRFVDAQVNIADNIVTLHVKDDIPLKEIWNRLQTRSLILIKDVRFE